MVENELIRLLNHVSMSACERRVAGRPEQGSRTHLEGRAGDKNSGQVSLQSGPAVVALPRLASPYLDFHTPAPVTPPVSSRPSFLCHWCMLHSSPCMAVEFITNIIFLSCLSTCLYFIVFISLLSPLTHSIPDCLS